jgi:uncharacterized OB-fold protein
MARPVQHTIEFPYTRSLGPIIGAFAEGLEQGRILASRAGGKVLCPPLEYDPYTGESAEPELVEVGPEGTVESWTYVPEPTRSHPSDGPFAFALIRLDGADTALVHAVDAAPGSLAVGTRVRPRWKDERTGLVTDIECFEVTT